MDLAAEGGIPTGTVRTLTAVVAAELAAYRELDILADADVKRMLELEGQRQAVGCGDSSCLAEIAGALGARLVAFGSVGQLGTTVIPHRNLVDSQKAESVGRQFVEVNDPSRAAALRRPKLRALLARTSAEQGSSCRPCLKKSPRILCRPRRRPRRAPAPSS